MGVHRGGAEEERQGGKEDEVMSEVHLGCPPRHSGLFTSYFTFSLACSSEEENRATEARDDGIPKQQHCLDEDGDLIVPRKPKKWVNCKVAIQHRITSTIRDVGFQVWKAAFVLADFVLHVSATSKEFHDICALELGAGTGLVGIILARVSRKVFLTDKSAEILENCATNIQLNSSFFKHGFNSVCVRAIDWKWGWPPPSTELSKYSWSPDEVQEAEGASLLLAADVIYSDDLTDSFFGTLKGLMSRGCEKVLYLALEKRYNFSFEDLDVVANGYEHFRSYLNEGSSSSRSPCFIGKQIDLSCVLSYLNEYERGTDLELWKITYQSQ
ncbi:putative methyltransferase family protein isoform X2 [Wolffia australiana]